MSRTLLHVPSVHIWFNPPTDSWHHGARYDPVTWPWWIRFRFHRVEIAGNINLRHKKLSHIGYCYEKPCHPDTAPNHYEDCSPRVYRRFYLYTRKRAYDVDVRIEYTS
jgi:hypothetical protein